jgi:hypothetical protein
MNLVIPDADVTERALSSLIELAQEDPANVPVLLAIATGFVKAGHIPRARNQLKRIQVCAPSSHRPSRLLCWPVLSLLRVRNLPRAVSSIENL